jgi:hypothetical protein
MAGTSISVMAVLVLVMAAIAVAQASPSVSTSDLEHQMDAGYIQQVSFNHCCSTHAGHAGLRRLSSKLMCTTQQLLGCSPS